MMVFWVLAALMIIVTLLIVLPPLLKQAQPKAVRRDALNAAIYKDQLAELTEDLNNETLSPEQFEQGRLDLERNLLADVSSVEDEAKARALPTSGRITAIVVGIAVPVLAVVTYLQLGKSSEVFAPQAQLAQSQAGMMAAMNGMTPEDMVQRLAERLKQNPNDGTGWAMLGRSYSVQGRFAEARDAYAKAIPLLEDDAQLLADYAEVLALNNSDQQLTGMPTELFEKALKLDPKNQKALWLAGMAAFQRQDFRTAGDYWKRLSASLPEDSEGAQTVKRHIAEAEARSAGSLTR